MNKPDARTKLELLYADVLGDVASLVDRLEKLRDGLPRDVAQAVAGHVLHFDRKIAEMNKASDDVAKILHQIAGQAEQIHTAAAEAAKAKVEGDILASVHATVQAAAKAVVQAELSAAYQQLGVATGHLNASTEAAIRRIQESAGVGWAAGSEAASAKVFWVAGAAIGGAAIMYIVMRMLG